MMRLRINGKLESVSLFSFMKCMILTYLVLVVAVIAMAWFFYIVGLY